MSIGSGLDPLQVLRNAGIACRQERAARNKKLITAADWAHCYPPESIDPHQLGIGGEDQPIHPGGDGTPGLAGFVVAELGMSIGSAERFIADALDLRHRLPRLWERLCGNEIDGWQAQVVAQQTRRLSRQQALLVDAAVADYVGRSAWAQVLRLLDAKIIEIDAEAIARLAEQRRSELGVWIGSGAEQGTKTVFVRAGAADVIWFDAMVDRFAELFARRGDRRPKDQRRAAAIGTLANPLHALRLLAEDDAPSLFDPEPDDRDRLDLDEPDDRDRLDLDEPDPGIWDPTTPNPNTSDPNTPNPNTSDPGSGNTGADADAAGTTRPARFPRLDDDHDLARAAIRTIGQLDPARMRPDATLYVHIALGSLQHGLGVTRVEDIGPIVTRLVADWLRDCTVTVKPVIDLPADLTPVDAYEVPKMMRERMFLRRPASVFPYSSSAGRSVDLDHSIPYREGIPGQTREDNLGPLARREHRLVTHGHWQRRQPGPGTYVFRAPHGRVFLVNQTGTHDLGRDHFAHLIWQSAAPEQPRS